MTLGGASTTVAATQAKGLDLVCDLERHTVASTNIRKGAGVPGGETVVRLRSRLRELPTAAAGQRVALSDERVDITFVPWWRDCLVSFAGSVVCTPTAGGTQVVHHEEVGAHGLLRPAFERFPGAWLARDVIAGVARRGRVLDQPVSADTEASS